MPVNRQPPGSGSTVHCTSSYGHSDSSTGSRLIARRSGSGSGSTGGGGGAGVRRPRMAVAVAELRVSGAREFGPARGWAKGERGGLGRCGGEERASWTGPWGGSGLREPGGLTGFWIRFFYF